MPLTAWQDFISKAFPGKGQAPNADQLAQLATQFFGAIPLPPGITPDQVISNTGAALEYKDAQGYVHRLERILDGRSPDAGQVKQFDTTNRPAVLGESPAGEQTKATGSALDQLMEIFKGQAAQRNSGNPVDTGLNPFLAQLSDITKNLSQPTGLAAIDPSTKAALDAINSATQMKLNQQFQDQSGQLVADLFGKGVNASSIAGSQANRMLQGQGLVQAQAQSDAAQRELAVRQFLSQLGQGNSAIAQQGAIAGGGLALDQYGRVTGAQQAQQASLQSFLSDLLNQALSREVSGSQLGLEGAKLAQQGSQFEKQMQQQYLQFQEQMREAQRQSMWNNIFKGVAMGTSALTGGLGGALGSLFSGLGGAAGAGGQATGWNIPLGGSSAGIPPLTWPSR